jgi:hypothetical protein
MIKKTQEHVVLLRTGTAQLIQRRLRWSLRRRIPPPEDAEEEEPMEHDQGSSGNVEKDDDLTWLNIFAGSKAAILAASKDFETAVAQQDQGPIISEEDLHALRLRISGACLFDGNSTVEGLRTT